MLHSPIQHSVIKPAVSTNPITPAAPTLQVKIGQGSAVVLNANLIQKQIQLPLGTLIDDFNYYAGLSKKLEPGLQSKKIVAAREITLGADWEKLAGQPGVEYVFEDGQLWTLDLEGFSAMCFAGITAVAEATNDWSHFPA